MSERLLALASGVHDGNPPVVAPEDMVKIAADAGYNSVGLWVAPGDNWRVSTTGEVCGALQESDLVALDVEVIWLQPGGKPDPVHHEIIAIGGEIGAKNCLIVSSEPDREITKYLYEDLCVHAERAGMRACLEYMAITEVKTLDDARTLGQNMIEVGTTMGKRVSALITDMNQPLGHVAGNAKLNRPTLFGAFGIWVCTGGARSCYHHHDSPISATVR